MSRPALRAAALALCGGAIAAAIALPSASGADDPAPSTTMLHVLGEGNVRVAPDVAQLDITMRSGAFQASRARGKVNQEANAVVAAIKALGIESADIQTSAVVLRRTTVKPLHPGGPRRPFFTASTSITVRTTKISLAGKVVDAATAHGADDIGGPEFSFGDPSKGRSEAEQAALLDARKRADAAAAAVGMHVSAVRKVDLDPGSEDVFSSAGAVQEKAAAPSPATHIEPGREEVSASVSVIFDLAG